LTNWRVFFVFKIRDCVAVELYIVGIQIQIGICDFTREVARGQTTFEDKGFHLQGRVSILHYFLGEKNSKIKKIMNFLL
jgi:hypothetical protein